MKRDDDFVVGLGGRVLALLPLLAAAVVALSAGTASADTPIFISYGAGARGQLDQPTKARSVESLDLTFVIPDSFLDQVLSGTRDPLDVVCRFEARNGTQNRKGVKVAVFAAVHMGDSTTTLGPLKRRTDRNGTAFARVAVPNPGKVGEPVTVKATLNPSGNKKITSWYGNCFFTALDFDPF